MDRELIRILLIEDDEDDYLLTKELIARIGEYHHFALEWAKTFEQGLDRIERGEHDVCLVDYCLGERNGLDLLEETKRANNSIPVILLTGLDNRETDMAAMRAGAADYLVKGQVSAALLDRSIRYALERSSMLKQLHELAIRDELTRLYNRRGFNRLLNEEIERYERYGDPVSLIILDVDNFKSINDTYGHYVGDKALQYIARWLLEGTRSMDRVARFGGDEFAIILPQTAGEKATRVAERLLREIVAQPYKIQSSVGIVTISVVISLGLADMPADAGDREKLMIAADQALYHAKRQGGNRVIRLSGRGM